MSTDEKNAETTHIRILNENWLTLNRMKTPGDSFDDVITKILEKVKK